MDGLLLESAVNHVETSVSMWWLQGPQLPRQPRTWPLPSACCARRADCHAVPAHAAGLQPSVHHYWGCTLYHPDDLPYSLWQAHNDAAEGSESSSPDAARRPAAAAPPAAAQRQDGGPCGRPNRQRRRFACLPQVMSDFRRPLQAHAPVRPPLPTPCPAGSGSSGVVLPPLPAALAAAAAEAGLLAAIPVELAGMYAAAGPAGAAALARWENLTGHRCASLAPAGSGAHDPRSAVPFAMGEEQGLARLRHFLGLPGGDPEGSHSDSGSGKPQRRPAPVDDYQQSRMTVRRGRSARWAYEIF